MKFSTLCFNLESQTIKTSAPLITSVLNWFKPYFLLCSGHSIFDEKQLQVLNVNLKKIKPKTFVVFEVKYDSLLLKIGNPTDLITNPKSPRLHRLYYWSLIAEKVIDIGYQPFGESTELLNKNDEKILIELLENQVERRTIKFGKFSCFVLCCGEINFLIGNNKSPLRTRSKKLTEAVLKADLVFNPIHDRMMNPFGAFTVKAKFLSKKGTGGNRLYLSSANWNPTKGQNKPTPTNQRMFLNGRELPPNSQRFINPNAYYSEFDYNNII